MNPIRIIIADECEILRSGFRGILTSQDGWQVVAESPHADGVRSLLSDHQPDVLVLDIALPGSNSAHWIRDLSGISPATRTLVTASQHMEPKTVQAFEAGAWGVMLKSEASSDLVTAVRLISQSRLFLTPTASQHALQSFRERGLRATESNSAKLTPRESEILRRVVAGEGNKEIAGALSVSVRTIETQRARLMEKVHSRSVIDLVRWAIRNQILEP